MTPRKRPEEAEAAVEATVEEQTTATEGEPKASTPAEEKPAKVAKGVTEIVVRFRDHVGNPTERTFSKEVHGDNFAKLADEFRATNAAKLITD